MGRLSSERARDSARAAESQWSSLILDKNRRADCGGLVRAATAWCRPGLSTACPSGQGRASVRHARLGFNRSHRRCTPAACAQMRVPQFSGRTAPLASGGHLRRHRWPRTGRCLRHTTVHPRRNAVAVPKIAGTVVPRAIHRPRILRIVSRTTVPCLPRNGPRMSFAFPLLVGGGVGAAFFAAHVRQIHVAIDDTTRPRPGGAARLTRAYQ